MRLTIPRLEIAGFVLVTTDHAEVDSLRRGALQAADRLAILAAQGVATQVRKVGGLLWELGFDVPPR